MFSSDNAKLRSTVNSAKRILDIQNPFISDRTMNILNKVFFEVLGESN